MIINQALRADTVREFGKPGWINFLYGMTSCRAYRAIATMRLCQHAASSRTTRLLLPSLRLLHRLTTHVAAIDLRWHTRVGEGLAITHGRGVVISSGASLGRNVTLFHGVTLGRRDAIATDLTRTASYPTIEDEVWIGPHATVVGGVTIGRGSRIAPGAFVTTDVPPYSLVVGNPARVVKTGIIPDVTNPA